jgi:hypothetical protein
MLRQAFEISRVRAEQAKEVQLAIAAAMRAAHTMFAIAGKSLLGVLATPLLAEVQELVSALPRAPPRA